MTDIDTPQYFSSCIAVNERDSNVLVGSSHLAQIARWDPRSPTTAAFITAGCRRKDPGNVRCRAFDPVYGVQWNPSDSNEFMSVHRRGVRIWDVRNMASDVYATFHDTDMPYLRSAKWSPHRTDCIAGLTMDGLVRIWKIRKLEGPASPSTPNMTPEPLFVHQGHELVISDFAWCPHTEDVIATVSPSTASHIGGIQVWRPRNLHDSDDHGEP
ncbi:MAG: WD40-repeat-containing domain protein [Benniella sp.]|nr:MAG: WD40-repeat-containing domain protein [Benniella sp.]